MILYFQIALVFFLLIFLKSFIRLIRSSLYLKKYSKKEIKYTGDKKLSILMPVYKEVPNIEKSVVFFKELSKICNVYYITTSKEKDGATYKEVEKQIKKHKTTNIFLENCPNEVGTMATQINFMAKKLEDDAIIGLYNIDSFPEVKTFEYVLSSIKQGECLQQVSYFDDDLKGVMSSAQDWQNRWSVVYEMGKMTNKSTFMNFTYTIGHGLFIYKKDLAQIGYWSDTFLNEDNELGYRMAVNKFKIRPIPYMEKADFAKNAKIYVKQQSVWINGPLYAFSYYKEYKKTDKKGSFLSAILNFKAAVSWLCLPWFFAANIIAAAFFNVWVSLALLGSLILYLSVINLGTRLTLYRRGYLKKPFAKHFLISDILFFFLHTFGPIRTLFKIMAGKNTIKNKYKTEK